jgi:hypothetical protein
VGWYTHAGENIIRGWVQFLEYRGNVETIYEKGLPTSTAGVREQMEELEAAWIGLDYSFVNRGNGSE